MESLRIKSTKSFKNLPCAHGQWFDRTPDDKPGHCASLHGYDREVIFTFSGDIDEYGWIYPFGDLKEVKSFLEYYWDHTSVLGADDPRLSEIDPSLYEEGGILGTLRILPYGVSMEMSSLFIWEHVNPHIYHKTGGRVFVEKVECKEHERNSAFLEVTPAIAENQAKKFSSISNTLVMKPVWEFESPKSAFNRITSFN